MKKMSLHVLMIFLIASFQGWNLVAQNNSDYIIKKDNGRIILAYKLFENFLNSDKSWESYRSMVLNACPEIKAAHDKALSWGNIDSVRFPVEVSSFKKEDWSKFFNLYDNKTLNFLYDSLITRANKTLPPIKSNALDLCLFLPYGGCYIIPGNERSTIFISLLIDPNDVPKIMIHEYSHNLHIQRRPTEPFTLHRELVSEGMAVYLTMLIMQKPDISTCIPFMPEANVKWCYENEKLIKTALKSELGDTTFNCLKKFIADGSVAAPPSGFVEKTGYFAGYRIIEACIKGGMKLEDICALDSDSVIEKSGYFKN